MSKAVSCSTTRCDEEGDISKALEGRSGEGRDHRPAGIAVNGAVASNSFVSNFFFINYQSKYIQNTHIHVQIIKNSKQLAYLSRSQRKNIIPSVNCVFLEIFYVYIKIYKLRRKNRFAFIFYGFRKQILID